MTSLVLRTVSFLILFVSLFWSAILFVNSCLGADLFSSVLGFFHFFCFGAVIALAFGAFGDGLAAGLEFQAPFNFLRFQILSMQTYGYL